MSFPFFIIHRARFLIRRKSSSFEFIVGVKGFNVNVFGYFFSLIRLSIITFLFHNSSRAPHMRRNNSDISFACGRLDYGCSRKCIILQETFSLCTKKGNTSTIPVCKEERVQTRRRISQQNISHIASCKILQKTLALLPTDRI